MKKVSFAIVGAAALALAACGGKHDNDEDDMTANSEQVMDNSADMNAMANDSMAPTENANKADEAKTDEAPKDEAPVDDSDANAAEVQAM